LNVIHLEFYPRTRHLEYDTRIPFTYACIFNIWLKYLNTRDARQVCIYVCTCTYIFLYTLNTPIKYSNIQIFSHRAHHTQTRVRVCVHVYVRVRACTCIHFTHIYASYIQITYSHTIHTTHRQGCVFCWHVVEVSQLLLCLQIFPWRYNYGSFACYKGLFCVYISLFCGTRRRSQPTTALPPNLPVKV